MVGSDVVVVVVVLVGVGMGVGQLLWWWLWLWELVWWSCVSFQQSRWVDWKTVVVVEDHYSHC